MLQVSYTCLVKDFHERHGKPVMVCFSIYFCLVHNILERTVLGTCRVCFEAWLLAAILKITNGAREPQAACVDLHADLHGDLYADIHLHVGLHADLHVDLYADLHVDLHADLHVDLYADFIHAFRQTFIYFCRTIYCIIFSMDVSPSRKMRTMISCLKWYATQEPSPPIATKKREYNIPLISVSKERQSSCFVHIL